MENGYVGYVVGDFDVSWDKCGGGIGVLVLVEVGSSPFDNASILLARGQLSEFDWFQVWDAQAVICPLVTVVLENWPSVACRGDVLIWVVEIGGAGGFLAFCG